MADLKKDSEIIAEIYRNAQLALTSISDILPEVEDVAIKEEILRQHEEYEKVCSKAAELAHKFDVDVKEPNPMKKAMMWSSIKMNTLTDNSRSHIAEMMVQGTVMGVTALKSSLGEMSKENADEEIKALAEELLAMEEEFEKKWKEFI